MCPTDEPLLPSSNVAAAATHTQTQAAKPKSSKKKKPALLESSYLSLPLYSSLSRIWMGTPVSYRVVLKARAEY